MLDGIQVLLNPNLCIRDKEAEVQEGKMTSLMSQSEIVSEWELESSLPNSCIGSLYYPTDQLLNFFLKKKCGVRWGG